MAKKSRGRPNEGLTERINIGLTGNLAQKLNDYIIAYAQAHQNKIPHGIKNDIARTAVKEWLEKHKTDFNINFKEPL
jgi:hypothetical protein